MVHPPSRTMTTPPSHPNTHVTQHQKTQMWNKPLGKRRDQEAVSFGLQGVNSAAWHHSLSGEMETGLKLEAQMSP